MVIVSFIDKQFLIFIKVAHFYYTIQISVSIVIRTFTGWFCCSHFATAWVLNNFFSGLLVSYLLLKELRRNEGNIKWLPFIAKFYFHRYWRYVLHWFILFMVLFVKFFILCTMHNYMKALSQSLFPVVASVITNYHNVYFKKHTIEGVLHKIT